MNIEVILPKDVSLQSADALVLPRFSDVDLGWGAVADKSTVAALESLQKRGVLPEKAKEIYWLPTPGGPVAGVLVVGLGRFEEFEAEIFRRIGGSIVGVVRANKIERLVLDATQGEALPIEALVEGLMLGQYHFKISGDENAEVPRNLDEFVVVIDDEPFQPFIQEGCEREALTCDAVNWARDLANRPPNDLPPRVLAAEAEQLAHEFDMKCTVFDAGQMEEMGLEGIVAVGKGSNEPPRLIVLEYAHPEAESTLALVGKGITFDTGGISIKPAPDMHEMKYDMCGAAAVLGAFRALAQLKPKTRLIGVIPSAENKMGSNAYFPGDILRMYGGITVEVLNTDAEGRIILADALAYVEDKYQPDAIVEMSTLTGAILHALGHYSAGLFTRDPDLSSQLQLAGDASGDRVWPMPMWSDYDRLLDGTHADVSNIGPRGQAGSVLAACFLQRFVKDTPFAHVDIAGAAWGAKNISYLDSDSASGFGVRLFTQWILEETSDVEETA